MIEGFVEAVETFQIRGWVFNTLSPQKRLEIEVLIGNQNIAKVTANLFRQDLLDGKIGDGRHAFISNFDVALSVEALQTIVVRTRIDDGWLVLDRLALEPHVAAVVTNKVSFEGCAVDLAQEPVFILGAARSGTSAIAQAMLKCGYEGHREGHLFDLLATWSVGLNTFFDENSDEHNSERDTMLSRFSQDYMNHALDEIFVRAVRAAFPARRWMDKTPNSNMIHLAPRFARIWPNAKFIFMKRRFFENYNSRTRKFPSFDFARNCREWAFAMEAWLQAKRSLGGKSIELDQRVLLESPLYCVQRIATLLNWNTLIAERFADALTNDWPERTSSYNGMVDGKFPPALSITALCWGKQELEIYNDICAPYMKKFGYTEDERYSITL